MFFLDNGFINPAPLYTRRIYTAKRIQEHIDLHLSKEESTRPKKGTNYNLSTSLLPGIHLKRLDSASGSRQVAAGPSAPSLRTSAGAIFIRFK